MTVRILGRTANRETRNAEALAAALEASEPALSHPDIALDVVCGLRLPDRELDAVVIYHDARDPSMQLRTPGGAPIHSFVMVVEVKGHSPSSVRFDGPALEVRYEGRWHNATDQCDAQRWALKKYQEMPHRGHRKREPTFVHAAIWLSRAARSAFDGRPARGSLPILFADLEWSDLTASLTTNKAFGAVRTLVDRADHRTHHSAQTLRAHLTHEVRATELDKIRIERLSQTRFDAEKTAYIQNLGKGLLILRGRGGTGKTFALVQIAMHLARRGKRTVLLTYNHGLIADISRALRLIAAEDPTLDPLPEIQTRYAFIQDAYTRTLGPDAERALRDAVPDIGAREDHRLEALLRHDAPSPSGHDFVLVDEGQDWAEPQRDLLYRLYGAERVVVADGVDQFVGDHRCEWDRGDVPINRRHRLRASRRTKAATCQTVAEVARALRVPDWDLEPDPDTQGGRFTVVVEPDARRAFGRCFDLLDADQTAHPDLTSVDNLVCLPSPRMAGGVNYPVLFDREVEARSRDSWRGFDSDDRRHYPHRDTQLRAVQYHSCRGMEGWTTICLGLDAFHATLAARPRIDVSRLEETVRAEEGLLFSLSVFEDRLAREERQYANNWLMIALTRSIDHLVVHLADADSALGRVLRDVRDGTEGAIDWLG